VLTRRNVASTRHKRRWRICAKAVKARLRADATKRRVHEEKKRAEDQCFVGGEFNIPSSRRRVHKQVSVIDSIPPG